MKRQREQFIVDGYNVIHAWPELSLIMERDLSEARDRLIHLLIEYSAFEEYDVIIVFDALFTADDAHQEQYGEHVTILYTAAGETADSRIERLAYEFARAGREVYVVTSDGAEQSVILGAGGYRLTPHELRRQIRLFEEKLRREFLPRKNTCLERNSLFKHLDQSVTAQLEHLRRQPD